jgi:hypothetical protein
MRKRIIRPMNRRLAAVVLIPFLLLSIAAVGVSSAAAAELSTRLGLPGMVDAAAHYELPFPAKPVPSNTVWLCKPGIPDNPCSGDLTSTVIEAGGAARVERSSVSAAPAIDCFYVYPTVSLQKSVNATLKIDPEERKVAQAEAARFSQVCNVYAPMYPQLTKMAIDDPQHISVSGAVSAYEGVWKAFLDYMAHYNRGRGIVFIGHSQGAFMLSLLLQAEVDSEPAVRSRLISALLPGGNITVRSGSQAGGEFQNIPACASADQLGCVVAYSTYSSTPPEDALFGRVDSPINPFHPDSPGALRVLCVNPSALAGGTGQLVSYLPTADLTSLLGSAAKRVRAAATPFVSYPGEYSAHCETDGPATWLQVDRTRQPGDTRPDLSAVANRTWGLHMVDVSIALGNLVDLVRSESVAYSRPH